MAFGDETVETEPVMEIGMGMWRREAVTTAAMAATAATAATVPWVELQPETAAAAAVANLQTPCKSSSRWVQSEAALLPRPG